MSGQVQVEDDPCQRAIEKYGAAARKVRTLVDEKAPAGAQAANEVIYGQTYQDMVKVCGGWPLKRKYTWRGVGPVGGHKK